MTLKMKIMLLFAKGYSITEGTKTNEGITVQYLISDTLDPCQGENDRGFRVTKGSLPLKEWDNIRDCPSLYEGVFTMATGSDGKAALKLTTLKYLAPIKTSV